MSTFEFERPSNDIGSNGSKSLIDRVFQKDINKVYFLYDPKQGSENEKREVSIEAIPDKLSYSYSPNFMAQGLLGRLSPLMIYTGGSDKTYSFSLKLHNDMPSLKNSSIVELIDSIKSLSYPKMSNGIVEMPQVYFQIGDLYGLGIVKTSVEWEKPFNMVDGYYLIATVSFTITVETPFKVASYRVRDTVEEEGLELTYTYDLTYDIPEEEMDLIKEMNEVYGFESSCLDYVSNGNNEVIEARKNFASNEYNNYSKRLNKIYGIFKEHTDPSTSRPEFLKDFIEKYTIDEYASSKDTLKEYSKKVRQVKLEFLEYLDEEYRPSDPESAPSTGDKEAIAQNIFLILNKMEALVEEMLGYGSGN